MHTPSHRYLRPFFSRSSFENDVLRLWHVEQAHLGWLSYPERVGEEGEGGGGAFRVGSFFRLPFFERADPKTQDRKSLETPYAH